MIERVQIQELKLAHICWSYFGKQIKTVQNHQNRPDPPTIIIFRILHGLQENVWNQRFISTQLTYLHLSFDRTCNTMYFLHTVQLGNIAILDICLNLTHQDVSSIPDAASLLLFSIPDAASSLLPISITVEGFPTSLTVSASSQLLRFSRFG